MNAALGCNMLGISPWGSCRCPSSSIRSRKYVPVVVAAAPAAQPLPAAQQQQQQQQQRQGCSHLLKLIKRHRPLSFFKWEKKLYKQLLELQEEQALLAGSDDGDGYYFSYWDVPDAHLPVLQDAAYQAAWARVFDSGGASLIKDKVVLDVGCGLGNLSIMAARAGAKHVYAVDASPGAAELARKIIAANGLSSKITVIAGRAEQVQLPVRPGDVDVLLCDWMGSMLLHDGLLPTLLRVSDRWLSPTGVILPDAASLHVMAIDDRQYLAEQSKLWSSQQLGPGGVDLKAALSAVIKHPRVDTISMKSQLVTDSQKLLQLDLYKSRLQDLTFQSSFALAAQREGRVSGLLTYFDVAFSARGQLQQPITFSTSPLAPSTSWLQCLFSFPRAIKMEPGQQLLGSFDVTPMGLPVGRMLDVDVEIEFAGSKARVAYQMKR